MGGTRRKRRGPGTRRPQHNSFADRLVATLRLRRNKRGAVYELDLRNKEWGRDTGKGHKKTLTVFCPTDPGWPDRGRTTDTYALAESWVREYYVPLLSKGGALVQAGRSANLTVAEACRQYIGHLERDLGADHNTVINRRSACRVHIEPRIGTYPIAALTRPLVRELLEGLQVADRMGGDSDWKPAMPRTRAHVRDTLSAVWRHVFQDDPVPFAGIRFADHEAKIRRRKAAREGRIESLINPTVFTRDQIIHILTAAMWYDRFVLGRPNLEGRVLPDTVEVIALQVGTAARIEEEMALRWFCIREDEEAVFIPGTKSDNAARWIPRQRSLAPWLDRLRALQGGSPGPDAFVVQTHPGRPFKQGSKKTYQGRIARVLRLAGLKLPRKCTHIFRATHLSWGSTRIPAPALRAYAGHSNPHGGAMDAYVSLLPPFMPDEHRTYIDLPTPEEIEARVASFRPAVDLRRARK
ncbi:MAG: site-specific integrase [Longimicrobiaceae bacterium]